MSPAELSSANPAIVPPVVNLLVLIQVGLEDDGVRRDSLEIGPTYVSSAAACEEFWAYPISSLIRS